MNSRYDEAVALLLREKPVNKADAIRILREAGFLETGKTYHNIINAYLKQSRRGKLPNLLIPTSMEKMKILGNSQKLYVKTKSGYRPATTTEITQCADHLLQHEIPDREIIKNSGNAIAQIQKYAKTNNVENKQFTVAMWLSNRLGIIKIEEIPPLVESKDDPQACHAQNKNLVEKALNINAASVLLGQHMAMELPEEEYNSRDSGQLPMEICKESFALIDIRMLGYICIYRRHALVAEPTSRDSRDQLVELPAQNIDVDGLVA